MKEDARDTRNRTWPLTFRLFLMVLLLATGGCGGHSAFRKSFGEQPLWPEQPPSKQAEERFRTQVKVRSNLAESHMKLGLHYQKSSRHDLAIKEFARAIRLNPKYVEALNGMGISLTSQGECEQATAAFQGALDLTEEPYLYNNFGCSSLICNEPGRAVQLFRRAAELDGGNSRIANNLHLAEMRDRLKSEVFTDQKTPVAVSPSPPLLGPVKENIAPVEAAPPTHLAEEHPADREKIAVLEQRTAPAAAGEATGHPKPPPARTTRNTDIPVFAASEMKRIRIPRGSWEIPISTIDPTWGIEVSNGNGMTGMAGRSAAFFRRQGFAVDRITNAGRYTIADTVIYYRKGYLDAAKALASVIPGEQHFEQVSDLGRKSIRIRVLLGRDMAAMKFPETAENIDKVETEAQRVALAAAQR